jgi:ribonuclease P/MRP protein subunit POP5
LLDIPKNLTFIQNRWLLVEFIPCSDGQSTRRPANEINGKQIWSALKQSVLNNFGDTGWGAVGLSLTGMLVPFHPLTLQISLMRHAVKYHSPTTNVCIIRVARDHHRIAWGAVTLLTSIEGHKYIPNVVHVSGERNLVSRRTLVIPLKHDLCRHD